MKATAVGAGPGHGTTQQKCNRQKRSLSANEVNVRTPLQRRRLMSPLTSDLAVETDTQTSVAIAGTAKSRITKLQYNASAASHQPTSRPRHPVR